MPYANGEVAEYGGKKLAILSSRRGEFRPIWGFGG